MILDVIAITIGLLGFAFGVRMYVELWKWARQCQQARVVVAYKRRVQINATIVEWLGWANQLSKDEASTGRTVYRNREVSVAVLRPPAPPRIGPAVRASIGRIRNTRKRRKAPPPK